MLKYRFLFIYLIVLILSVGAVCAQEYNISDDNISIVNDDSNVLLTSEFVIDDSNYGDYFDKESGVILDNSSISDGDGTVLFHTEKQCLK